ncbi:MAG: hypothetical protein IT183_06315 [Acidobacteria bacterium]|nr:hypothetical protein [Acidobacteriota bacterium]
MRKETNAKYEVLVRVNDFGTAHGELFPASSVGGQAFAEVAKSVADFETHFGDAVRAAEEARRVKAGKRRAVIEGLKAISHTGRGWATRATGQNLFRLPSRKSATAILEAARRFMADAEPRKAEFVRMGLPPDFLTELRAAVDAFARAIEGRRAGRLQARKARAAIDASLARGSAALRTLDIVVVNAVRRDPVVAAAWDGARRIEGSRRAASVTTTTGAPVAEDAASPPAAEEEAA